MKTDEVVHIGDSLSSDVKGAVQMGIDAVWINRSGKKAPEGVRVVRHLMQILNLLR